MLRGGLFGCQFLDRSLVRRSLLGGQFLGCRLFFRDAFGSSLIRSECVERRGELGSGFGVMHVVRMSLLCAIGRFAERSRHL